MPDRFVVGVPLGRWQTNCYVVGDRDRGTSVVIDPGEGATDEVPRILAATGTEAEAILLSHGHLDHHWSAPALGRALDVPVHLHPADRWLWDDPAAGFGLDPSASAGILRQQFGLEWDPPHERLRELEDHGSLHLAGIDVTVRHNPGHTPGHCTFLATGLAGVPVSFALGEHETPTGDVLFSGDLVFAGSIGRTDFPRGSTEAMFQSLVDTVLALEDDTLILSGHGPDTTVGRERAHNPFLAEARTRVG